MSEIRSDNRLENHPKPVQEFERKRIPDTINYIDWASIAEVNAAYDIVYRANKYFWIAGVLYHCTDGTNYRAVASSGSGALFGIDVRVVADASTLTVSALSGKTFMLAVKGAQPFNSDYVSQTETTLDFTSVGGVVTGELITIFYK